MLKRWEGVERESGVRIRERERERQRETDKQTDTEREKDRSLPSAACCQPQTGSLPCSSPGSEWSVLQSASSAVPSAQPTGMSLLHMMAASGKGVAD